MQKVATGDFGFAFNNSNFSDKIICIQILDESRSEEEESHVKIDLVVQKRKRRRAEIDKEDPTEEEGQGVGHRLLHINSAILAAQSRFFFKLFTNGMKESGRSYVTLKINAYEEEALMELFFFMYTNTLTATTVPALLDILMVADKYQVDLCIKHCSSIIHSYMATNPDSALIFLDLPLTISMAGPVKPLVDAAKQYLVARYKDIRKFEEEVLNLPLVAIETIFSSDIVQAGSSTDAVCDFILKWVQMHFHTTEERRKVLDEHLYQLIRFDSLSHWKTHEIVDHPEYNGEFGDDLASRCIDAIFS